MLEEEFAEACAAVSDAKNQLRKQDGSLEAMVVKVGDLFDGTEDVAAIPLETADSPPGLLAVRCFGWALELRFSNVKPGMLWTEPRTTNLGWRQNPTRWGTWPISTESIVKVKARACCYVELSLARRALTTGWLEEAVALLAAPEHLRSAGPWRSQWSFEG